MNLTLFIVILFTVVVAVCVSGGLILAIRTKHNIISFIAGLCIIGFVIGGIMLSSKVHSWVREEPTNEEVVMVQDIFKDKFEISSNKNYCYYVGDDGKVLKVKGESSRVFYDLEPGQKPYMEYIKCERWIIYWYELGLHLREE